MRLVALARKMAEIRQRRLDLEAQAATLPDAALAPQLTALAHDLLTLSAEARALEAGQQTTPERRGSTTRRQSDGDDSTPDEGAGAE